MLSDKVSSQSSIALLQKLGARKRIQWSLGTSTARPCGRPLTKSNHDWLKNLLSAPRGLPLVMLPHKKINGFVGPSVEAGTRPRNESAETYGHVLRQFAQSTHGASQ